jgi:hypothetical protein
MTPLRTLEPGMAVMMDARSQTGSMLSVASLGGARHGRRLMNCN